ncbi:MAG TPA: acetylglutamate kinase [Flavisolibacter sp.]|nr:acetylglutamate kinase [Flavisolibacter sp.]
MDKLYIIKIGGNVIDQEPKLERFLKAFSELEGRKILVHGGGKLATQLAAQMNIPQQMVDGRRITDGETLKVVTMVYAGYINKTIVARLQALSCNAIGLSGADGNVMTAHKRINAAIDYGFAGDMDAVHGNLLTELLRKGLSPVLAPITHDGRGQLLNTNADTIAQEVAKEMSRSYETILIYSFEKNGVLKDPEKDDSVIPVINPEQYRQLKHAGIVSGGMIPKLDNAFAALQQGVSQLIIGNAETLTDLITGKAGTIIRND